MARLSLALAVVCAGEPVRRLVDNAHPALKEALADHLPCTAPSAKRQKTAALPALEDWRGTEAAAEDVVEDVLVAEGQIVSEASVTSATNAATWQRIAGVRPATLSRLLRLRSLRTS